MSFGIALADSMVFLRVLDFVGLPRASLNKPCYSYPDLSSNSDNQRLISSQ